MAKYFLEGCAAILDTPGEWAYAAPNPTNDTHILLRPTAQMVKNGFDGFAKGNGHVRGRTVDYCLRVEGGSGLVLSGLRLVLPLLALR